MGHGIDDSGHGELTAQEGGCEGGDGPECHEVLGRIGPPHDEAGGEGTLRVYVLVGHLQPTHTQHAMHNFNFFNLFRKKSGKKECGQRLFVCMYICKYSRY